MDSNHECFAVFGGDNTLPKRIVRLTRNLQEEKFSDVLILRVSSIERAISGVHSISLNRLLGSCMYFVTLGSGRGQFAVACPHALFGLALQNN
jgi:hypothetical protein